MDKRLTLGGFQKANYAHAPSAITKISFIHHIYLSLQRYIKKIGNQNYR